MKSLLLDRTAWDLVLDSSGNIAVCTEPYAIAQDVACACRLFLGECWYDTTLGVPYFEKILGQRPSLAIVRAELENAAMTVPGVVSAKAIITSNNNRVLTGIIEFIDATGAANNVTL